MLEAILLKKVSNPDKKEIREMKIRLQRPILVDKWERTKVEQAERTKLRGADEIIKKREQLYQGFLVADRQSNQDLALDLRAKIKALDWVIGGEDELV